MALYSLLSGKFNRTPSQLLQEALTLVAINVGHVYPYTNVLQNIARYSLIQRSDPKQHSVNKFSHPVFNIAT